MGTFERAVTRRSFAAELTVLATAIVIAFLVGSAREAGPNLVPAVAAPPSQFWQACPTGAAAGQCGIPRGIGINRDNGHLFVADQDNRRIIEFTAWSEFVKAWGWDVVSTGPGDDTTVPVNQLEICVPADGDVCKAGVNGGGTGQFRVIQGVDVDAAGNIYVMDRDNFRVQKFSPAGQFLLMFGGDVNQTKVETLGSTPQERNVCSVSTGDTCQAGIQGTASGYFGSGAVGDYLTISFDDKVYVGDANRIQRFNTDGEHQENIALAGESVQSLATDSAGNLYARFAAKADIRKLSSTGTPLGTFTLANPMAVAVDVDGNVYAIDGNEGEIVQFDPAGNREEEFAEDLNPASTGIATSSACLTEATRLAEGSNVYFSNLLSPHFIRAYGPVPDKLDAEGNLVCPAEERPPEIKAQYAAAVDTETAQLRAEINPWFWGDTSYHVEYGTSDCAASPGACGERIPVVGETPLGAGAVNVPVTTAGVFLQGLAPQTTYHFRFIAQSSGGGPVKGAGGTETVDGPAGSFTTFPLPPGPKTNCPNQRFRIGAGTRLPDCRAYELVSPVEKGGGDVEAISSPKLGPSVPEAHDQSAGDGNALTYSSQRAFCDIEGAPWSSQYLAHRDPETGWSCDGISPPRENFPGLTAQELVGEFKAFSEDLSQGWLIHDANPPLAPCAPLDSMNIYRRDNLTDTYEALNCEPIPQVGDTIAAKPFELQGVSADGCRAVFRSKGKLTDDANPLDPSKDDQTYQLYQSSCKGPLRHVGKLPGGANCTSTATAGSEGGGDDGRRNLVWHAFSGDAHRLYWSCAGDLHVRNDPDLDVEGDEQVTLISVDASFQAATASEGSTALFVSGDELLIYDAVADTTEPISGDVVGGSPSGSGILLGASDDANRAYFASTQVLTGAEQNSEGSAAVPGEPNLYLYEATEGGPELTFVATLADEDLGSGADPGPANQMAAWRSSRVSPDGLHAAFISVAPLSGYDNTDLNSGEADAEVFLYDAAANGGAGELDCISCNPSGARPAGRNLGTPAAGTNLWGAAYIPGWMSQLYPTRVLSDDGSRLFFNSYDALLLRDTNGKRDVYEWSEADGKAQCEALGADLYVEAAGGCLSLITSGQSPTDSEFVDADRKGDNVFVRTAESLLGHDPGSVDIYDARAGGGFPPPATPPPPCEGEACQSPSAPPAFTNPSSGSVVGPGDPKPQGKPRPRRCPKGKRRVRKAGKTRCVKRQSTKQRRAGGNKGRAGR